MTRRAPFGGGVFIADTSAWTRWRHPVVSDEWTRAYESQQIAASPIVAIELVYSARDAVAFDAVDSELSALRQIPITRATTKAALAALRELAHRRPLAHRIPLPDVLIAASAQDAGVGVLHYDRHYDRLAEVMSFESRWIAPPGSLG